MTKAVAALAPKCGPAVLAIAMGISRQEAAILIRSENRRQGITRRTFTNVRVLTAILNAHGHPATLTHVYAKRRSLGRWMAQHTGVSIVLAGHHFVLLADGRVLEDNGVLPLRARVHQEITINVKEATI